MSDIAVPSNLNHTTTVSSSKTSHPKGLYVLFFAELWERFSYYGMRALLVLYMTKELIFSTERSLGIYGAYGALVYAAPVLGGYLADQLLGNRRAIYTGGVIIAMGHFILALPMSWSLYVGIAFIIVGTGFFKANVASMVGQLYQKGDIRRDSGFTLFYMGINTGGFLAPLLCGIVGERFGWHYGFALAGFGMLLGIAVLYAGRDILKNVGNPPAGKKLDVPVWAGLSRYKWTVVGGVLMIPVTALAIYSYNALGYFMQVFGVLILGLVSYMAWTCKGEERKCVLTILLMLFFCMVFWSCFEQAGGSMNLFAERNVDRHFLGWEIPASWFQSVNSFFIITMAPFVSMIWTKLAERRGDLVTSTKFALGLLQVGIGFGCLMLAVQYADPRGMTSMAWLVLAYFFHTSGELCLSPVSLSMVSKLSPARFVSFFMGASYLSISFAHYLGSLLARFFCECSEKDITNDKLASLDVFYKIFEALFYFPILAAGVLFLVGFFIKNIFKRHA